MKLGLANPNASKNTYISWSRGDMVLVGEYFSCYGVKECYAYVGIENWGKKMFVFDHEENKLFASKEWENKLCGSVGENIMLFHLKTANFPMQKW